MTDEQLMRAAIREAGKAEALGETPIGCVIAREGKIIARGYNRRMTDKQTLAHAELFALRKACKKAGDWRLEDCTLYVTLEPCPMCAGAIVQEAGLLGETCADLMRDFFRTLREKKRAAQTESAEGTEKTE